MKKKICGQNPHVASPKHTPHKTKWTMQVASYKFGTIEKTQTMQNNEVPNDKIKRYGH